MKQASQNMIDLGLNPEVSYVSTTTYPRFDGRDAVIGTETFFNDELRTQEIIGIFHDPMFHADADAPSVRFFPAQILAYDEYMDATHGRVVRIGSEPTSEVPF